MNGSLCSIFLPTPPTLFVGGEGGGGVGREEEYKDLDSPDSSSKLTFLLWIFDPT